MTKDKKKMTEVQSLAILPIEVIHLGRVHNVTKSAQSQQLGIEREGFILQRDLYRYFLRNMNKYQMDRTFLLDLEKTNVLLTQLEAATEQKLELSVREISEWLGVDGIITGSVDQLAPGNALLTGLVNGKLGNDSNVKVSLSLRSKFGQIYWRHTDERPSGKDNVYEVSKDLLRNAVKDFFDKLDRVQPKGKKLKNKNKQAKKEDKED
jgi:hypothetical protein